MNTEKGRYGEIHISDKTRLLRGQLEQYIAEEFGADRVSSGKNQTELRKIKKEMANLKKRLNELQAQRTELEKQMRK